MTVMSFWAIIGDEMWVANITPGTKPPVSPLMSHWISLQDKIQTDFVGAAFWDRQAFSSSNSWPQVRQWILSVTAKHCRNCDGPFRTSGAGCLVTVLSCCTITFGHSRLDGQYISCRSFNWLLFNCPPCSPDLALNDFHLFLHLKKFLSDQHQRFQNDRQEEMSVTLWFQSQAADFYDTRIQKFIT